MIKIEQWDDTLIDGAHDKNIHHSNKFKEIIANLSFYVFYSFSTFNMLNILILYIEVHLDYVILLNGNNIINNHLCNAHVYLSIHVLMWYLRMLLQKERHVLHRTFKKRFIIHPFATPPFDKSMMNMTLILTCLMYFTMT